MLVRPNVRPETIPRWSRSAGAACRRTSPAPRTHGLAPLLDAYRRGQVLRWLRRLRALLQGRYRLRGQLGSARPAVRVAVIRF